MMKIAVLIAKVRCRYRNPVSIVDRIGEYTNDVRPVPKGGTESRA